MEVEEVLVFQQEIIRQMEEAVLVLVAMGALQEMHKEVWHF